MNVQNTNEAIKILRKSDYKVFRRFVVGYNESGFISTDGEEVFMKHLKESNSDYEVLELVDCDGFVTTITTVQHIIDALKQLPPDLPCRFRPKYSGTVKWTESVPVNKNGISIMQDGLVYFLC
jgi:hypothetical protein